MERSTKNRIIKKPEYYSEEFKWQVVQGKQNNQARVQQQLQIWVCFNQRGSDDNQTKHRVL
jgi:hypothetical protein